MNSSGHDAIIVGSGPNGLAAAITLARKGLKVLVLEANQQLGGGARTSELTLTGFHHDVCSAIHPMGLASSFFQSVPLEEHGLEWIHPPAPLAHPLDDGTAVMLERSVDETAEKLGPDAATYRRLFQPLVDGADKLYADLLGPFRIPRSPLLGLRFGLSALRSASGLARSRFRTEQARALFAGIAGHSVLPLDQAPSAAVGLMLGIAGHSVGWPLPKGGSQKITDALIAYFKTLGGEVVTGQRVKNIDELPAAKAVLLDVTPRQMLDLAGHRLPGGYKRQLERYRYGAGVFKLDWALSQPIPWKAKECSRAATIHLGGTLEEIVTSERAPSRGEICERPYVLVAQQSLFDPTRAPNGKHTGWAYCHVPHGSQVDMTEIIENQMERFAPGFRDCILARHAMSTAFFQEHNANYIGGDIGGGIQDFRQLFTRPAIRISPYTTPLKQLYICSSSTPPGGGVHGMCGYHAAKAALWRSFS
ncbi:MAG: phytoene desaturase family protein [Pirellulaceae bacterium]